MNLLQGAASVRCCRAVQRNLSPSPLTLLSCVLASLSENSPSVVVTWLLEAPCVYDIPSTVVVKKLLLFPKALARQSKGNVHVLCPMLVAREVDYLDLQSLIVC